MTIPSKLHQRQKRIRRVRTMVSKSDLPRLLVFRSSKAIYAQIIDQGKIIAGASNLKGEKGIKGAEKVGEIIAQQAKTKKISRVVFDRNGYQYHGNIAALAESARKAGLTF